MLSYANTLFDLSQLEKRKTPTQLEFEQENYDLLMAIPTIVEKCFKRLNNEVLAIIEPHSRDKNLCAVLVSGFMRGELIKAFPQYCVKATKTRFKLKTAKLQWLYIKKFNYKLRPMNIDTLDNKKIINQLSDSPTDTEANIFIGYTATSDKTQPTGVYAICIEGEVTHWVSDLNKLARQAPVKHLTETKETTLKDGIVKLKKTGE